MQIPKNQIFTKKVTLVTLLLQTFKSVGVPMQKNIFYIYAYIYI